MASRIQGDAVGLTLHDERHFAALWEAADLLVPDDTMLTPVEVFILGVAILIHDAAHTILAFEGGLEALSKTPEWADNLAPYLIDEDAAETSSNAEGPVKRAVLFSTVRALHAKQAEKIIGMSFRHPAFGADLFLIEDATIRLHMGRVIGQVAASHHWDLSQVAQLPKSANVVSPYHSFGAIRPLLLAALMRTADAIQIDGHRAPDFEFALAKPAGVSHDHWTAQNRLAKGADPDDPEALLINSTADFTESDASAWWVAFDLATTADRELHTTNALLKDFGLPTLRLTRVKDVSEPTRFAKHVRTNGWYPVRADVRVGNTADLVAMLGGKGLYGDDVIVPLRELIQNAVDAVRARRLLEPEYKGTVWVDLAKGQNSAAEDGYWLSVADNGIGMSPAILLGPFLTFGESGWSGSKLKAERPGFVGKRFRPIGRFGIGFFSAFMYSDEVRVTSRSFDAAVSSTKILRFQSGLGLRPLLQDAPSPTSSIVTRVSVFLQDAEVKRMLWARDETTVLHVGKPATKRPAASFTMAELLGVICPAIDVELIGSDDISGKRDTISDNWQTEDGLGWLRRVNGRLDDLPPVVETNVELMQVIISNGIPVGRAALSPISQEIGAYTVGGLANKRTAGVVTAQHFFGTIDSPPTGPKRDPASSRSAVLAKWASEQVAAWARVDLTPEQQNHIAVAACHFDGDPGPLANARVDQEWRSLDEIYNLLVQHQTLLAPVTTLGAPEHGWLIMGQVNLQSGFLYHPEEIVVERKNVLTSASLHDSKAYWAIPDDGWPKLNSFVGTLGRYARWKERELTIQGENIDFGYYDGPTVAHRLLVNGTRIVLPAFKLTLEK
ncbi:hypothetical protein [Sinorhizobium meliloti]|uniref:HD domain-containing protein n=1 Tax=Rhizobium meliloti TaxID=382 RepID=UPI00398D0A18